jgi:hypothetical protein
MFKAEGTPVAVAKGWNGGEENFGEPTHRVCQEIYGARVEAAGPRRPRPSTPGPPSETSPRTIFNEFCIVINRRSSVYPIAL